MKLINIKSNGIAEEVLPKNNLFHTRRSVIIVDEIEKIFFVVHGKTVSKKVHDLAELYVKEQNAKMGFQWTIKNLLPKEGKVVLQELLDRPPTSVPESVSQNDKSRVPLAPVVMKKRAKTRFHATYDDPLVIKEFNIAYYESSPLENIQESLKLITDPNDLSALSDFLTMVSDLIMANADKQKASEKLNIELKKFIARVFE